MRSATENPVGCHAGRFPKVRGEAIGDRTVDAEDGEPSGKNGNCGHYRRYAGGSTEGAEGKKQLLSLST